MNGFSGITVVAVMMAAMWGLAGCGGDTTNVTNTTVVSPVVVTGVSPEKAIIGEGIAVYGQNFGASQGASTLTIGGTKVTEIVSWSDSKILAKVPAGASTGNVTVTVNGVAGAPGFLIVTAWHVTNPDNVAITTAANDQSAPQVVADGAGGAIAVWTDMRNSTADIDIYMQRVSSAGAVGSSADAAVAATTGSQESPRIMLDDNGGTFVVWSDRRGTSAEIYAHHFASNGAAQWTVANGIQITTALGDQANPEVVSDGAGGAIIVWADGRNGFSNVDIYAQRVSSDGVMQWTADGVAITAATGNQIDPRIVSDGAGGAIIVWKDSRSGTSDDIYAQRVNSAGAAQWTADGVAISTAAGNQSLPELISDDAGGAIAAWMDLRSGTADIYAQRVNSAGAVQWAADGVAISAATGNQTSPKIVTDAAGGAIAVWADARNGASNVDIYAQRVNSAGAVQWTADGVAISTTTHNQGVPKIVGDGAGGAIIAWADDRWGDGDSTDIYAQRVNSAGVVLWTTDGVPVSTAPGEQNEPRIVSDSAGGAIVVWSDSRNGVGNKDIYAQRISASGS